MFDSSVLNIVVGLVLIFLLYSLLASAMQEALATLLGRRANMLYDGIKSMLTNTPSDKTNVGLILLSIKNMLGRFVAWAQDLIFTKRKKDKLYEKFYDHPIIKNYGQNWLFKKPSYLSAQNFSSVLLDVIKDIGTPAKDSSKPTTNSVVTFQDTKNVINNQGNNNKIDSEVLKILNFHLNEAGGDLDVFKHRIESWYNDSMDRVSGWYKRNTHFWLFFIGMFLAITMNIDTIEIATFLSKNKKPAEQLAQMGVAAAGNPAMKQDTAISQQALDTIRKNINQVNTLLGLGWSDYGQHDSLYVRGLIQMDKPGLLKRFLTSFPSFWKCSDAIKVYRAAQRLKTSAGTDTLGQFKKEFDKSPAVFRRWYIYDNTGQKKFFGFFITAIAIGLGAPFWFDLLNKFVNLRASGKSIDPSGSTTKNNTVSKTEIDG